MTTSPVTIATKKLLNLFQLEDVVPGWAEGIGVSRGLFGMQSCPKCMSSFSRRRECTLCRRPIRRFIRPLSNRWSHSGGSRLFTLEECYEKGLLRKTQPSFQKALRSLDAAMGRFPRAVNQIEVFHGGFFSIGPSASHLTRSCREHCGLPP